jgi:hypothetical protein
MSSLSVAAKLWSILGSAACVTRTIAPAAPPGPLRAASLEEALGAFEGYCRGIETLSASGDLDVRDYRAGKGTHSYLIDTCNRLDTRLPEHALEIQHVEHAHPIDPLLFVTFFEKIVDPSGALTRIPSQLVQKMGRDRLISLPELLSNLFYR